MLHHRETVDPEKCTAESIAWSESAFCPLLLCTEFPLLTSPSPTMQRHILKLTLSLTLAFATSTLAAQTPWNNKRCAVALTYDDALHVHLDHAIPALDSVGLKGTFYLSAYMPGCRERINDWKKAAERGHELGNHTLFHPCIGNTPGRQWVTAERDLSRYTMDRFVDEIKMTNTFLSSLDGKTKRTFAYTCGDTVVQNQSVIPKIEPDFVSARGVHPVMIPAKQTEVYNVGSYMINGQSGKQLIDLVKQAMKTNSAIVFLFHGVGGEHNINVDLKAHHELLQFLKANEKDIWIAPFIEITEFLKENKK